ncbi:MAG: orotate phosphoribosyltransferase [Gammaproteobacteria bacterium]|nr:orotate phosphoribosyltransferase [Gammaproteobacteria bacterium]OUV68696.1 MAG: orotate phosphoribosyltransferase [Gammaproteobacteria bacterium TMED133]
MLAKYQSDFIEYALGAGVLSFGEYQLKSGRISPYFFNAGAFDTGQRLSRVGYFYAAALIDSGLPYEVLFGPAYKGIPLVSATSVALYDQFGLDVPYAFNRKELKDHGEGGLIVGADVDGKVVIIDDVITAGTAVRESMNILSEIGASVSGILVGIDRQEKGSGKLSAIQEVQHEFGIDVISIIQLDTIIEYLEENNLDENVLRLISDYRKQYGILVG